MRIVLVILLAVMAAQPALAQNSRALRAAAERALNKERYCDAAFLYSKLEEREPGGDALAHAGEAAERGNDRPRALAFYKAFIAKVPRHPRVRAAERSITELEKLIAKSGNGRPCGAAPAAECGNGLVEGAESCDDGNTQDGDGCSRTCGGGGYVAGPTPLPGITALPVPVALPPTPLPVVAAPPRPAPPPTPAPPPPPTPPPPTPPPPPAPAPAAAPVEGELCTLIKPIKVFQKGEWKTIDFGSTITIRTRGPEFTKVEAASGEVKVASSALDGACAKEGGVSGPAPPAPTPAPAPAPLAFEDPDQGDEDDEDVLSDVEPAATPAPAVVEQDPELSAERDRDQQDRRIDPIEPLHSERGPAHTAPEVEEGGGGLGGFITMGIGAALLVGGGAGSVVGLLPFLEHQGLCGASVVSLSGCPQLTAIGDDFADADNDDDRADAADDARRLKTRVDNAAQEWDGQGRWLFAGGAAAAGLGVGVAVTGLIIALAGGADDEEEE